MAQQNRLNLKSNFRTGDRPAQEDFENVFDSFINSLDDQISVDTNKNLQVGGAITMTSTGNEPTLPGTIRWNGTEFQGHNGTDWGPLGGGDSPWVFESGTNIIFSGGNVGIATTTPLTDLLEVALTQGQKVRFGNAAIGNGPTLGLRDYAMFSHTSLRASNNYAIAQSPSGGLFVNCASGESIRFAISNSTQAALISNNFIVGSAAVVDANPAYRLQVAGSAFKNDGLGQWNVTSDIRTKENIRPFKDGLNQLKQVQPIQFTYNGKANTQKGLECIGVSAQEINEIFPDMVQKSVCADDLEEGTAKNELLTTNLSALQFVLVNAIKELDERIEKLEKINTTK
jgi:hypothetical protein